MLAPDCCLSVGCRSQLEEHPPSQRHNSTALPFLLARTGGVFKSSCWTLVDPCCSFGIGCRNQVEHAERMLFIVGSRARSATHLVAHPVAAGVVCKTIRTAFLGLSCHTLQPATLTACSCWAHNPSHIWPLRQLLPGRKPLSWQLLNGQTAFRATDRAVLMPLEKF